MFGVGPHLVGIEVARLEEMFVLPEIHAPPDLPPNRRGLAMLRGSALPAVDLRVCLGLASAASEVEELLSLLRDREQDHKDWLAELEASIREDRPFGLATDPRLCKFGKWYYAYRTDNAVLRNELSRIGPPHARIHALADRVTALRAAGEAKGALELVERAKLGCMSELVHLFSKLRDAIREQHREVGVTVLLPGGRTVLIVDRAEAVADLERFAEGDDPLATGDLKADMVRSMAIWSRSKQPVLLLDLDRLADV